MAEHCAHARYVWNLAVEQLGYPSRGQRMPGYAERDRQLTEARRAFGWLGAGSVTVQQQALRDGHVARESRKSQALFRCVVCGHTSNADLNAARNIAAGHAVTARGGLPLGGPVNREPQHAPSLVA